MKKRYKSGNVGKERHYEEKQGRDRSESGFWVGKFFKIGKTLPLALLLAIVFSITAVVVSEGIPGIPFMPIVNDHSVIPPDCNLTSDRVDKFTYFLNITPARDARITALEIYQPATNKWEEFKLVPPLTNEPWDFGKHVANKTRNVTISPFIKQSQGGFPSYRFKYEDGFLTTYLGPYAGPELPAPSPGEPVVDFYLTNITAYLGPESGDPLNSTEAEFYSSTNETTAFEFVVNAKAGHTQWYDISLMFEDPITNEWTTKGNERVGLAANVYKSLTWTGIRPFEALAKRSLNRSEIEKYIGKRSNFRFVYGGKSSQLFRGPELVVAFDNPMFPPVLTFEDTFNYSIDVIGSKELNITLEYCCEGRWTSDNIMSPANATWNNVDVTDWTTLTWECQAINTWEAVRFKWWKGGSSVCRLGLEVLQMGDKKRSYLVPVIVEQ